MAVQGWSRDPGLVARVLRRHVAVLAAIVAVAVSVLPQAGPVAEAAQPPPLVAAPTAVVVAPAMGESASRSSSDDPALRPECSTPVLSVRSTSGHRFHAEQTPAPNPGPVVSGDEAFLAGVYRCNPDGRGPPSKV